MIFTKRLGVEVMKVIIDKIKIPELTGNEERNLYIRLPESYDYESERYPVLYMFDGHNVFFDSHATYGKSWGMGEYLDRVGAKLIVVAVECNHDGYGRLHEYSPFPVKVKPEGMLKGQGGLYMDWLVDTLKPLVDNMFRTLPDREYTYISGSSMGGLMSVFAVTKYNHIFSKAAALSPSLYFGTAKVTELIKDSRFEEDTVIYMDYGSEEMRDHKNAAVAFKKVFNAFMDKRVKVCARIVPGGTHCEASWERQIPVFMQCLGI